MSLPFTATLSGAFAHRGFTNAAVMSLPPSWPQARDVSTTVAGCSAPLGVLPGRVAPAMFACARRW